MENYSEIEKTSTPELRIIDGSEIISITKELIANGADRSAAGWLIGSNNPPVDEAVVAIANDKLAGAATLVYGTDIFPTQPYLRGIYVLPEFRRRGYATNLVKTALERCGETSDELVRINIASTAMHKVMANLPAEVKDGFWVIDHRSPENLFEYDN